MSACARILAAQSSIKSPRTIIAEGTEGFVLPLMVDGNPPHQQRMPWLPDRAVYDSQLLRGSASCMCWSHMPL